GNSATVTGDAANDLVSITLDPNVLIQESKAGTCDIRPGRRPHGQALLDLVQDYQQRAGATPETGNQPLTDRRKWWDSCSGPRIRPPMPVGRMCTRARGSSP